MSVKRALGRPKNTKNNPADWYTTSVVWIYATDLAALYNVTWDLLTPRDKKMAQNFRTCAKGVGARYMSRIPLNTGGENAWLNCDKFCRCQHAQVTCIYGIQSWSSLCLKTQGGSHVMLVSTYVPTKMGPFVRPRYPLGWILKVLCIQMGQNIWTSIYW